MFGLKRRGAREPARRPGRVLHILKYYRPSFTGEGVFLERCSNFMQGLAPEVTHDLLVTVTPRPAEISRDCSTLRSVFYLTKGTLPSLRHELLLVLWFIRNIRHYDTVHFRTHADWHFLTYLFVRLMGRKLILSATLNDSVPVLVSQYRANLQPLALRLFRMFDGFVSISPKLQEETASLAPVEKCHLIPCGITFPWQDSNNRGAMRTQLGIPDDALVLIFVGGLCARKDPMLLVRYLPEVLAERPDTWLLLVGPELEDHYVAEMRQLIARTGIGHRVVFVGEVADPHPYYAAADIMTFASHMEGFGTVVPEAQANGLPVVVRRLPGVNDLFVKDEETGFFFDNDDEYLDGVLRLVRDQDLRRTIGSRAREFVRASFDMSVVARQYLNLYGFSCEPTGQDVPLVDTCAAIARLKMNASVVNPAFHTPPADATDRPVVLTMLDAEEAFDWSRPFDRQETDVSSMRAQIHAQKIFARFGVVPTYLVDYPIVTQDAGRGPLREYLADGACDIGTQLHPWVSPPFVETVTERNSYPGNLPTGLEYQKIRALTDSIEQSLGVRPRVYRAGRYGAGTRTADILKSLGYQADSSVMPCWDFSHQYGPDYIPVSALPHWIDSERTLLELPCSAAIVGAMNSSRGLQRMVYAPLAEHLGVPSLTARLGIMERIKLTPEGITIHEAKRLVRHMRERGHQTFVLTYHTPSMVPGNTPYVRTEADLRGILRWLEEFYDFFINEIGGRAATWREVYGSMAARR